MKSVTREPHRTPGPGEGAAAPRDEMAAFGSILRRRWKLLAIPVVLGLCLLGLYIAFAPRQYTATAQILIEIQKPRILGGEAVDSGLDTSRYMIGPVIDSQVEILLSNRLADRVVRATGLNEDPDYVAQENILDTVLGLVDWLFADEPGSAATRDERNLEAAIANFQRRLDVRRKGVTLILYVRYSDQSPVRAAEVANATAQAYLAAQRESQIAAARQATELLNEQVAELRQQVIEGEQKLQQFSVSNNLLPVGGLTVSEREISETVSQLILARTEGATKRAELQQVERLASDPDAATSISRVLSSEVMRDLRSQESEVRRRLAVVSAQFGSQDTQAAAARAELEDVKGEIARAVDRIIQNARIDYEVAMSRIGFLEENLARMTAEFGTGNRLFLERSQLERELNATRDLYVTLLTRLKETTVQQSLLYPDARIIDAAAIPRRPSGPRKLLLIAIALFGSLFVGVTLVVMREHFSAPGGFAVAEPGPPIRGRRARATSQAAE